jgi:hypothetical protein
MPNFNRVLSGRAALVTSSRTVTGATNVAATDLNNEIVFNSPSTAVITLPAGNGLNATVDDAVYVFIAGLGIPTFAWTGGTIRVPSGLAPGVQYGYMAVKWAPTNEWVQV